MTNEFFDHPELFSGLVNDEVKILNQQLPDYEIWNEDTHFVVKKNSDENFGFMVAKKNNGTFTIIGAPPNVMITPEKGFNVNLYTIINTIKFS